MNVFSIRVYGEICMTKKSKNSYNTVKKVFLCLFLRGRERNFSSAMDIELGKCYYIISGGELL